LLIEGIDDGRRFDRCSVGRKYIDHNVPIIQSNPRQNNATTVLI
jgi:hypothetical protein